MARGPVAPRWPSIPFFPSQADCRRCLLFSTARQRRPAVDIVSPGSRLPVSSNTPGRFTLRGHPGARIRHEQTTPQGRKSDPPLGSCGSTWSGRPPGLTGLGSSGAGRAGQALAGPCPGSGPGTRAHARTPGPAAAAAGRAAHSGDSAARTRHARSPDAEGRTDGQTERTEGERAEREMEESGALAALRLEQRRPRDCAARLCLCPGAPRAPPRDHSVDAPSRSPGLPPSAPTRVFPERFSAASCAAAPTPARHEAADWTGASRARPPTPDPPSGGVGGGHAASERPPLRPHALALSDQYCQGKETETPAAPLARVLRSAPVCLRVRARARPADAGP